MHLEENTEDVAVREANYDHLCQTTSWLSGKTKALAWNMGRKVQIDVLNMILHMTYMYTCI